ncbi:hypothetical protein Tco_0774956 [Tanacetum coccineum]|uniref:Uncharacterized protein n=1 Tax=Tanacetum coccineum TaxID=301880 RepID=A0ABQ4ZTI9_9ASTR
MAGISGAATTTAVTPPPLTGKPTITSSSLPSSYPSRYKRHNHLRHKILKTLDPTRPEDLTRKNPTFPQKDPFQQHPDEEKNFSEMGLSGFENGAFFKNLENKSFLKIGFYLIGAFVFQTVCAVLIFGSKEIFDESEEKGRGLDLGVKRNELAESNEIENEGEMVEMDDRIVEIREMAREARRQEKIEAIRRGLVNDDDDDDDVDFDSVEKSVKEKEVDGRLMKLKKSLEGNYEKLPNVKGLRNEGEGSDDGEEFGSLMFKKKFKYKSPSVDSGDKPKGFGNGAVRMDKVNDEGVSSVGSDNEPRNKPVDTEAIAGTSKELQDNNQASNMETRKPRGFGQESSDTAVSTKQDDSNRNAGLKGRKGGNKNSAKKTGDIKSSTPTGFWWTSLPYVLAVHMQRGEEDEESGLFVIRSDSQTQSGLIHTVAFEDRGDAMNFCYLLESFFEDLEDFSTNIIPIPTNELEDEINSQIRKVVVVKKGQLQLYVGKPLPEVESALRILIEQSEKS